MVMSTSAQRQPRQRALCGLCLRVAYGGLDGQYEAVRRGTV